MKTHLSVFALSAILVVSIGMAPAFGQVQSAITVTTDKESYMGGEVIMVSGEVRDLYTGIPVSITVTSSNGNRVAIDQVTVNPDKTFSADITAGGPLMKIEGTYTVVAQYGADSRSASTSFELTDVIIDDGMKDVMISIEPSAGDVMVTGNEDLLVGYELTTGDILSITPDVKETALVIAIATNEDGTLKITIPRTVADATHDDGTDDTYFVLVDLEEVDFEETVTDDSRTLTIDFPAGAEEIRIYGTFVIPEFGTIAAMILAVAVVAIIAVSARSRLSIIPRY